MSTPHDETMLDLVAVYAIGGIDATTGECAAIRSHIAECAICREEFRIARAAAAAVGLSASETPPPHLRERILSGLPAQAVQMQRRVSWFVPAAAAAAVVIGAGIWWNAHRSAAQTWAAVCVPGVAACHASGVVTVSRADHMRLRVNGLAALPASKAYQAWLIAPGAPPKPEPTFSANKRGEGLVEIPAAPAKGEILAVTVEPAGGSQKPSTKPFLIAKIE